MGAVKDWEIFREDFVSEFTYHCPDGRTTIEVAKVGGGTLGKAYAGRWAYIIFVGDEVDSYGDDLTMGMPHTHTYIAKELALDVYSRLEGDL